MKLTPLALLAALALGAAPVLAENPKSKPAIAASFAGGIHELDGRHGPDDPGSFAQLAGPQEAAVEAAREETKKVEWLSPAAVIPEPHTWMLMFAGLAAIGWLGRRR